VTAIEGDKCKIENTYRCYHRGHDALLISTFSSSVVTVVTKITLKLMISENLHLN